MELIANKNKIKISKKEWQNIGRKNGWMPKKLFAFETIKEMQSKSNSNIEKLKKETKMTTKKERNFKEWNKIGNTMNLINLSAENTLEENNEPFQSPSPEEPQNSEDTREINLDQSLEKWESDSNYMGQDYYDYYPLIGRTRDSNLLDQSNFSEAQKKLQAITEENAFDWMIVRSSHWAVGWIESILIHENASDEIKREAIEIKEDLQSYPVLNEDSYSELELEESVDLWESKQTPEERMGFLEFMEEILGINLENKESLINKSYSELPDELRDGISAMANE